MYYDPAATGERIQNLRKDREVTQEQLAIDLNISDRYMRNLEKGEKVPSVDLFVELRERFGSSLDYIVLGVSASQREQGFDSKQGIRLYKCYFALQNACWAVPKPHLF